MTNPTIRFIRRGQIVTLANVPPSRTLLEVLREDLDSTGTKEGCGEGDCGACTVVLGEAVDGRIVYRAINACIRLAHSIDGLAVWTAEDLAADPLIRTATGSKAAGLHPVQEALVQCHGSQCGFCTPGFAMSLFSVYQNQVCQGRSVTREHAQAALSGNLCRCTGYRPILDAAETMADYPARAVNEAELLLKLKQLMAIPRWDTADSMKEMAYLTPQDLPELLALRHAHPQAQIVAGCTDAGLWVTKQHRTFAQVIDLTRVERYPHHIAIGAAVTLTDAFDALVADRPQLLSFAQRFAGLPVRNSGTLGGNVANGSPIGDSMPLLIALGANVVLMSRRKGKTASRELPLEDLYTGYRQNVMAKDEVLAWIKVPLPQEGEPSAAPGRPKQASTPPGGSAAHAVASVGVEFLRAYKISKRFEDDISAVCLAICLHVDDGRIRRASIGVGGVAATPARARRTEACLVGQPAEPATFEQAAAVLGAEFQPISDMRASAGYRRELLGNLMQRFAREFHGETNVSIDTLVLEDRP